MRERLYLNTDFKEVFCAISITNIYFETGFSLPVSAIGWTNANLAFGLVYMFSYPCTYIYLFNDNYYYYKQY